jgi:hypothetical protein
MEWFVHLDQEASLPAKRFHFHDQSTPLDSTSTHSSITSILTLPQKDQDIFTMSITKIDEIGDLTLIVGPEKFRFQVSSHALRFASPVWRAMLTGPFREATATEISFEDDDPAAMRILLLMAHLQFPKVPQQLSFDTLVNLASLCDKYDTASLVKTCGKDLLGPCQSSSSHDKIWVYWVLGFEEEFKEYCAQVWKNIGINDNGDCLISGQLALKGNLPSTIIGKWSV